MRVSRTVCLLSATVGLLGCRPRADPAASGPRLELRWTGSESASFHAPATAEWCDSLHLLEIVAMGGDTGVAIAIYPRGGVASGAYPVRPPAAADSTPPSSAIGLRWFSQTSVRGFQSDSGTLSLSRGADGALSGRFSAAAHPVTGKGPLELNGSFEALRQRPAARGCSRGARPDPSVEPDTADSDTSDSELD